MKPQNKKINLDIKALAFFEAINKKSPTNKLAKLIAVLKRPLPDTRNNYREVSPELVFDVIPSVITSPENKSTLENLLLDSLCEMAKAEFQLDFTREELKALCYQMMGITAQENNKPGLSN